MLEAGRDGVLVTRPEPAARETADRLRAIGFRPILAPLMRIEPRVLRATAGVDAVLATSGNAIAALGPWRDVMLLAVGDRTAEMARAAGFARVHSADGDAAALARLVRTLLSPGARLLLASGARQGVPLATTLRDRGYRVLRRVAYAAQPMHRLPDAAAQALQGEHVHAALFLSAETARVFTALLPQPLHAALLQVTAIAIAPHTAEAISHLRWRSLRVSAKPTLDDVLALL